MSRITSSSSRAWARATCSRHTPHWVSLPHTDRVKLRALITVCTTDGPLAKAITTPDVLSGGRAVLGIGAGRHEEESRSLGSRSPPRRSVFEILDETFEYVPKMWSHTSGRTGCRTFRRHFPGHIRRSWSVVAGKEKPCTPS
ncbi:MAG TPA: LLM class flavin-dependent oxidoreductase [Amycolatopsis sp.]|uniref:LLM class flavin-dependent oxidoreductase n=1 Tax=Amycolatopsis sp. TaxID=37632 RepID=UPI002B46E669|nr:LLM class flavin-dependent oxidoreductase [Amycolatopsis sp.]HKS47413.1 LLM class flavin-dependent oxidoreductase [Amycolatopsis sp.]